MAGLFPGVIMSAAEIALERPLPVPLSVLLTTFQGQVATYLVLLGSCLLVFRWIAGAASAWFEVVVQSRSPRPILVFSVATALVLVVGTLASASFVVMFSFSVTPWREWGPGWIYFLTVWLPEVPFYSRRWRFGGFHLAAPWGRQVAKPTDWRGGYSSTASRPSFQIRSHCVPAALC